VQVPAHCFSAFRTKPVEWENMSPSTLSQTQDLSHCKFLHFTRYIVQDISSDLKQVHEYAKYYSGWCVYTDDWNTSLAQDKQFEKSKWEELDKLQISLTKDCPRFQKRSIFLRTFQHFKHENRDFFHMDKDVERKKSYWTFYQVNQYIPSVTTAT